MIRIFFLSFFVCSCVPMSRPEPSDVHTAQQLIERGVVHLRGRQFEKAKAAFSLSFEVVPSAAAADGFGCALAGEGELDLAETYFRQALELDPSYAYALGNLAWVRAEQGDVRSARVLYQRAMLGAPTEARFRNNFAVSALRDGMSFQQSTDELMKARELAQDSLLEDNLDKLRRVQ